MRRILPAVALCLSLCSLVQPDAEAQSSKKPALSVAGLNPNPDSVGTVRVDPSTVLIDPGPDQAHLSPVADTSPTLSLADAEARALKNQPRLLSEQLRAQAANKRITESTSAYFPQVNGNLTAVETNGDTAVAAGALTTSSISTRAAGGLSIVQMVTDFGRTSNLVRSARSQAQATGQLAETTRQMVLRDVDDAYFAAQAAESVRRTAQAVLDFRSVSLRQLSALAQSQLRSTLDVQFAQVLVSEAELAVVRANSGAEKAQARLAAAMGDENDPDYLFADEPLPPEPDADTAGYITEAIENRPDLKALRLQSDSAKHFAQAEKQLSFPTVNALATGGEVPEHDSTIHPDYGAVGINVQVPIFNGRLYSTRSAVAKLEARAADEDVGQQAVEITRDVRMAWADARDGYQQIQVAQDLVDQTNVAMRLAQARYDAGLGSIVELNQAELAQTSALITAASARFDYQRTMAAFHFALGISH